MKTAMPSNGVETPPLKEKVLGRSGTIKKKAYKAMAVKKIGKPGQDWMSSWVKANAYANRKDLDEIEVFACMAIEGFAFNGSSVRVATIDTLNIAKKAFFFCRNLEKVVLTSRLRNIREEAFAFCEKLSEIELPEKLEKIEAAAFAHCKSLKKVTIPASVQKIGKCAFWNCTSLAEVVFLGSPELGEDVFKDCPYGKAGQAEGQAEDAATRPSEGEPVLKIEGRTLVSVEGGTGEVAVPDGVEVIGDDAFSECPGVTEIKLPSTLKELGVCALGNRFGDAPGIEKIEIPDGPEELCMTFCNCKALKEVKLPSTVKVVDRAFRDCTSLETVELPAGVETIAENSFAGCVVLKEVRFPKGAKVARGAFAGCPKTLKKKKY